MKILQVNKFYHVVGGSDRYFLELTKLLGNNHNEIAILSMKDKRNNKNKWNKYFLENLSFEKVNYTLGLKLLARMFYSVESARKINKLYCIFPFKLAHIHSIYHHISPSILFEIKKKNIPIILTVNDYHLISSHHNNLYHNGKICEVSKITRFYNIVRYKCVKDSYFASFAEMFEQYIHHFFGFYSRTIDYYLAPTAFLEKKLIQYQIPKSKIVHLPYFIDYEQYEVSRNTGDYVLYFGRLSPEKGLTVLLEAIKFLPKIQFKLCGKGIMDKILSKKIKMYDLKNVELIPDFISDINLRKIIFRCRFTVLPSQSLEIFGVSLLEAFATGKPVIASNIGGIPEIVKDGYNGYLVEPGNAEDLANKISKLWDNPSLCKKMGKNAREYVEKNYGPQEHYEKLMDIYRKAIDRHR
ncbi:MAG: glycosyltransferase family 4 protein [Patescibacteria group bacterium]|nr:glycosyltransferase family 4 protein [Patescibacteria group bacterium]